MAIYLERSQQSVDSRRKVFGRFAKWIDVFLNLMLFVALLSHLVFRSGLLFPNPISHKLEGAHTFIWLLGIFLVWISWKLVAGHVSRSKPVPLDKRD